MNLYLIVAKGKHEGMPIPIKVDLFLMGSDALCQLRSKLPGIAPQHCALVQRDEKAFVKDMAGGETYLNEELMPPGEEWPIHAGDRLVVGPLEFQIEFQEEQLNQKSAEEWALKSLDRMGGRKDARYARRSPTEEAPTDLPPDSAAAAAASILDQLQSKRGNVRGRIRVIQNDSITEVRFNDTNLIEEAELTYVKKELFNSVNRHGLRVLLDFKNVERMSSAAVDMILEARRRVRAQTGTIALCHVRPELETMLETLNVLPLIPHFRDKKNALVEEW